MPESEIVRLTELTLPSGRRVEVRRPPAAFIGSLGLTLEALKTMRGETPVDGITDPQAADLAWAMREMLKYSMVKPALSLTPQSPNEIHPRDMAFTDALCVIQWAVGTEDGHRPGQGNSPRPRRKCRIRARRLRHGRR